MCSLTVVVVCPQSPIRPVCEQVEEDAQSPSDSLYESENEASDSDVDDGFSIASTSDFSTPDSRNAEYYPHSRED